MYPEWYNHAWPVQGTSHKAHLDESSSAAPTCLKPFLSWVSPAPLRGWCCGALLSLKNLFTNSSVLRHWGYIFVSEERCGCQQDKQCCSLPMLAQASMQSPAAHVHKTVQTKTVLGNGSNKISAESLCISPPAVASNLILHLACSVLFCIPVAFSSAHFVMLLSRWWEQEDKNVTGNLWVGPACKLISVLTQMVWLQKHEVTKRVLNAREEPTDESITFCLFR